MIRSFVAQRRLYVRDEVFHRVERKHDFLRRVNLDSLRRRDWVALFRIVGRVQFERVRYRRRKRLGYFDWYFARRVRFSGSAARFV